MPNEFLKRLSLILALTIFSLNTAANICVELPDISNEKFTFTDRVTIQSQDGTTLSANLFTPNNAAPPAGFPAIIFINSWGLEEHQYLLQAAQFAEKGYLVLSYSARGWGCSGGQVNVAGEKDVADISTIVDWLLANTAIDVENIGISGISYGSGFSLVGLAQEPRLKTAVAMSTWGSLVDSLYQHETPRALWGFLLVSSGLITANMDPAIGQNYVNLLARNDITETLAWADRRSASNMINLINERNAPVYLANNFGDNLFQPNNLMKFYSQLTVPKRLDLNQGTHASSEALGLVGIDTYTWSNTHRWFDYWLRGIDTRIMDEKPVTMLRDLSTERDEFNDYPIPSAREKKFYLSPRPFMSQGGLQESPYRSWFKVTNQIFSGLDTTATTGIPILSAILDGQLRTPVKTRMKLINPANGIVFRSSRLDETLKIRGIPEVTLNIKPSHSKAQLVGYLYDIAPNGKGTLITHGPITLHEARARRSTEISWELVATAYDVPAGHRVGIAFDTFDILYGVPTLLPYTIKFEFKGELDSVLKLPIID